MVALDPTTSPTAHSRSTGAKVLLGITTAALVIGGFLMDQTVIGALIAVFVLVVPFEKLFPRHQQRVRRPELGTDLSYAFASALLSVAGIAVGVFVAVFSFTWLPALALRPLVLSLPPFVTFVAGFLLFDVAAYWTHRLAHEVPFLWRFHKVHHSTKRLDWISGIRAHPFDGIIGVPAFVLLLVAGFPLEVSGSLLVAQTIVGLFLHANVRWRLRPLQRIVATPEFHHWHHANVPEAWHTNYSGFLPILDVIFGTYRMPVNERPTMYGIDEELPAGIVGQLWNPLRGLRSVKTTVRHPIRSARQTMGDLRRGLGQIKESATRRPPRPLAGERGVAGF